MSNTIQYRIIRKPDALELFGISKSNLHIKINRGTFPPPISLGDRAVGFLAHELEATLKAMARGLEERELKKLVEQLVGSR